MIIYKPHQIKYGKNKTFKGIPKQTYHQEIAKLDYELKKDFHDNEIAEQISN